MHWWEMGAGSRVFVWEVMCEFALLHENAQTVPSCAPSALRAGGPSACGWVLAADGTLFCLFVNKEGNPRCFSRLSVGAVLGKRNGERK